jgi:glutaredoxin
MDKIEIYTNNTCPYCKQIKEELTKKDIKFEDKSTSEFTGEYQQIVNLTGMPTIPTVKYKDEYFVPGRDFQNAEQLVNILETFESSNYNDSRKTLERIKTLNFNINTAFGRMDQLLRQIETKINKEDEHKSTS